MSNYLQFSALLAVFCNVALTLLVVVRGQRSTINRLFVLWGTAMTVCNFGTFFMFHAQSHDEAMRWARFLSFGVILIPITNLHLTLLIAQMSLGRLLWILYFLYGCVLASLFTGHFLSGVTDLGYAWYSQAGPAFYGFVALYMVSTTATMAVLFRKQKVLSGFDRTRLRSLLVAFSILLIFGSNDLLPIIGIYKYPFTSTTIYPWGQPGTIAYNIVMGYSVLQHQLLDIQVQLSRSAAQLVRLLFATLAGFVLLLLASQLVDIKAGVFAVALGTVFVSSLFTTAFFPRFLGKGEETLERKLLGDRFDYHEHIQAFLQKMQSRPDSQVLIPQLHELLINRMRLKSYQIILLEENTRSFALTHTHPERLLQPLPELRADSPLIRHFQGAHPGYLACRIAYSMPGETGLERAARQQLKEFAPEFCFPFRSERDVFGLLLLGAKANGDPYTTEDLRLLTELVQNLNLLLNQVRLKNQIAAAQEQEMLGRMSRGLAHDLNNLLTPVQTFLQLTSQGLMDKEGTDELLPVAMRNVETVRSYINEALYFSRTHRLEVKPARIDETVRAAVEVMEPRARQKSIQFRLEGLTPSLLEIDAVMIQRLLGNLVSNAVDASPPGATVQIHLVRLPRTEAGRDWFRLKIVDAGEGISQDNLERVFTPYFTTKDKGDGQRGFGLGLAIARKIVHLHGGNLNIASVEKKGTTVQVDLPSRHTPSGPEAQMKVTDATFR